MALSSLEIGKRALLAQRFGLDVTSNNIANVNTEGYSRREATFTETDPRYKSGNYIGTGVIASTLRNFREEYFDKEIRTNISQKTFHEKDQEIFLRIQAILNEPSDGGLNETINEFFIEFDSLAVNPENVGIREQILALGEQVVDRFHNIDQSFKDTRQELFVSAAGDISLANNLLKEIAELNKGLTQTKLGNPTGAQTIIDQREQKLEELSEIVDIAVTENPDRTLNVFSAGINLVTGPVANQMKLEESISASGERTAVLYKVDNKKNVSKVDISPTGGKLASKMKHYNETFDDNDSSGNLSAASELNIFAQALAENVNQYMVNGYGLDDKSSPPPNRTFFSSGTGFISAASIEISSDVKNKPREIAISSRPNEPGNSEIAVDITRIATDSGFLNGQNPSEFYSNYIGRIGIAGNESKNFFETSQIVNEQLLSQRDSVIGVNMDEEAINLVKYQKAFEAASRVVNTVDEMLTTIINLGR